MRPLTLSQRAFLRARAHGLDPVVRVGAEGVSDAVIEEIDRSLKRHELLKIKMAGGDREVRTAALDAICAALDAAPVQHIGKTLVLYRPAEKPKIALP